MLQLQKINYVCGMYVFVGLDEELAEVLHKDFYKSYKTWKSDNNYAETKSQVNSLN